jgi:hypothetical protein
MADSLRDLRGAFVDALTNNKDSGPATLPKSALKLWGADLSLTVKDTAASVTETAVLSKFLRARDGNVQEALSMLLKTLQVFQYLPRKYDSHSNM